MTKLICILGVDGSGKSTIIRGIGDYLKANEKDFFYVHLYPKFSNIEDDTVSESNPPALPVQYAKYNKFFSILKFSWVVLITHRFVISQRMFKNKHYVLFDRYLYDFLISPERCAMSDLGALSRIFSYLIPKCDKTIVLWGDPEKIHIRKPELSILQIDDIQKKQFKYFEKSDNLFFLNTSEFSPLECIDKIKGFIELK